MAKATKGSRRNIKGIGHNKLTLEQKVAIIHRLESSTSDYTQADAAKEFLVSKSAISYLMKRKELVLTEAERGMDPKSKRMKRVERFDRMIIDRLRLYIKETGARPKMGVIFSTANAIAKEENLLSNRGKGPGQWEATCGWFSRFARRVNIGQALST